MKRTLLFLSIATGVAIFILTKRATPVASHISTLAVAPAPAATPAPLAPASPSTRIATGRPDRLVALEQKVAELTERISNAEKELETAGFPAVLGDERLDAKQREEILTKLTKASELRDQLSALKIQMIDLEADRKWAK